MATIKTWTDEEERRAVNLLEYPMRVEVFDLLMSERLTAKQMSDRLDQRENLIQYHCRRLIKAGAVEVVEIEQVRGVKAKILRPTPLGLYAREWV